MFNFLNDAKTRLWVYSIGSTLLISAFPCFILAFIPVKVLFNKYFNFFDINLYIF